jgi:hypothetical protein
MTLVNLDIRRRMVVTALAAGLGFAFLAGQGGNAAEAASAQNQAADVQTAFMANAEQVRAGANLTPNRSAQREPIAPAVVAVEAPKEETKAPEQAPPPPPEKPKEVAPVAGLNETQMNNAKKIVETAKGMGLGKRAQAIAIATAMQESNLYNLGNPTYEVSLGLADGGRVGWDHDSVGLFQQRPVSGWGSPENIMKPEYAAHSFLSRLVAVPGWEDMALTYAAQAVQVSAYPDAYAKHESRANEVVDAFNQ